jgi:aspartate racemase
MTASPTPPERAGAPVPFRIGIVGGMGPMAGVYLQQLIVEGTPAERDQDHLEVVCFTNPHVPERMRSLAEDGGRRYAAAVRASAQLVAAAGATCLAIPCNTAHARLPEIQDGVAVPILDMIELGIEALVVRHGRGCHVGLLATVGTLNERVYQERAGDRVGGWVLPDGADQDRVGDAIRAVKIGRLPDAAPLLIPVLHRLRARGAGVVIVGCTELSMCFDRLAPAGVALVDPLRVLAGRLVELGLGARGQG